MTSEYHRAGIHLVCTGVFVYYARVCISACVRGRAGGEEKEKKKKKMCINTYTNVRLILLCKQVYITFF